MNNSIKKSNLKRQELDWNVIQSQMKNKLGSEVYESWLKKIYFVEEFNNYILLKVPTSKAAVMESLPRVRSSLTLAMTISSRL